MAVQASLEALVTLNEAAAYLNVLAANLSLEQQDSLQDRINAISEAIKNHCRTPLVKQAATEYYDGGSCRIQLRRWPMDTSATFTVKENGVVLTPAKDGSNQTAAGGSPDFWYLPDENVIERNGTWLTGRRIVTVTYTAGRCVQMTTGNAVRTAEGQPLVGVDGPKDLREACMIIVKAHQDFGPTSWGPQMVGDQAVRPAAWPLAARLILDRQYVYMGG